MGVTDYHSTHNDMATIPYVAHEIIVAKHKRREKTLAIALAVSALIGIINLVIH